MTGILRFSKDVFKVHFPEESQNLSLSGERLTMKRGIHTIWADNLENIFNTVVSCFDLELSLKTTGQCMLLI